jgi:hypothetical protein
MWADCEFHKFPWGLRTNDYFGEFRPPSLFVNPQHGAGFDFSHHEALRNPFAVVG